MSCLTIHSHVTSNYRRLAKEWALLAFPPPHPLCLGGKKKQNW